MYTYTIKQKKKNKTILVLSCILDVLSFQLNYYYFYNIKKYSQSLNLRPPLIYSNCQLS